MQGQTQEGGPEISEKKKNQKNSNTHPYGIEKLSIKTNIQKSLFLNILRYNHLPTKTKYTKYYCFFNFFFFLRFTWARLMIYDFGGGPKLQSKGAEV